MLLGVYSAKHAGILMVMIRVRRFVATVLTTLALCVAIALPVQAGTYNCGTYGAGDYQTGTCAATTEEQPSGLENTGQMLLPLLIPALLILLGTVGLFYARKRSKRKDTANHS